MDLIVQNNKTYSASDRFGNPNNSTEDSTAKDNPVCFEVPSNYEITIIGKKLIGSAQARKQGVVLQHGSLPLVGDIARICEALTFSDEAAREAAQDRVRARAITLEGALGEAIAWDRAANALKHGFREALNLEFETGELSEAEWQRARELREAKYERVA